jgi:hypothetical protein
MLEVARAKPIYHEIREEPVLLVHDRHTKREFRLVSSRSLDAGRDDAAEAPRHFLPFRWFEPERRDELR